MTSIDKIYNRAANLIENACLEESRVRSDLLVRKAISMLVELIERNQHVDADVYYLIGYGWYCIRQESLIRDANIRKYLHVALAIDSHHNFARIYLAHHLFDCKKYDEALLNFKMVDASFFMERLQAWRVIKLYELIVCCELYINKGSCDESSLAVYLETLSSTDDIDHPMPSELRTCIEALSRKKVDPHILRELDKANLLEA